MNTLDAASSREMLLIYVAKGLRCFCMGIICVIFFQNLYLKGVTQMMAGFIQAGIVFGDMIVTNILTKKAAKIGYVNTLLIAGLLNVVTGCFYVWYQNLLLLMVTGIIGIISATGGEFGPFAKIQTLFINSLTQSKLGLKQRYMSYYHVIGYVAKALGCIFSGIFVLIQLSYLSNYEEDAIMYLFIIYFILCILLMLVYSSLNTQFLQTKDTINQYQIEVCQCSNKGSKFKFLLLLITKFCNSAASGFLALTYISFYYYQKFQFQIFTVGILTAILVIINGLSNNLCSRVSKVITPMSSLLYLHLPANLLLMYATFTSKASTSVLIILLYFLTSKMNKPAKDIFEHSLLTESDIIQNKQVFKIIQSFGLMFSLGITGILMAFSPHIPGFSIPLIITGAINTIFSILISVILCNYAPLEQISHQPLASEYSGEIIQKQQRQQLHTFDSS